VGFFATITPISKARINNQITAPELLVVDEDGQRLGVLPLKQALAEAKERDLDLIEVSPNAKPPVARIMSFDKHRYEEEKKLKKQRAKQRSQGMKQVQISVREAKHDLARKASLVNEFLSENNQVEVLLFLRGREKANKDFARKKLEEFLTIITPDHKILSPIQFAGRGFVVQLAQK